MSNRAIYAIMGIVVAVALVGLWFLVKAPADDAPATAAPPVGKPSGFAGHEAPPVPNRTPVLAGGSGANELPERVKEYAANGAIVRDHRTGTHAPIDLDPNARPQNDRKIDPNLTKAVADQVRGVMHDCIQALPASARGENPRLEGTLTIAIANKAVLVNKAQINIRDVNGDAAETTRQCIEQKSLALTHDAGAEPDMPSYDINLSFTLI